MIKVLIDNFNPACEGISDVTEQLELADSLDVNPLNHLTYIDEELQCYIENLHEIEMNDNGLSANDQGSLTVSDIKNSQEESLMVYEVNVN